MFSVTYTVDDIKTALKNDYAYFGYASDYDFEAAITDNCDDVYRRYYLPRLGATEYTRIATKNKVGLTTSETYLYWSEIYTVCFEFLRWISSVSGSLQSSENETLKVEGYTHSTGTSSGGGSSQGEAALEMYRRRMYEYWKLAGYDLSAISRTCNIFGDTDASEIETTILVV